MIALREYADTDLERLVHLANSGNVSQSLVYTFPYPNISPDKIDVTRQTVNAIEQGKYSASLEGAFRIATVFNKPLESVFHYSKD
jgi:hypothetical protein